MKYFWKVPIHDSTQMCRKCLSNKVILEIHDRYDKQESFITFGVTEKFEWKWPSITFLCDKVTCICCFSNSQNGWTSDTDIACIILPVLFKHDFSTFWNYFFVFFCREDYCKIHAFLPFQHRLQFFNCDILEIAWLHHLFPASNIF